MNSSGQKTGFSIAVMIGVIIIAGVAVDLWDARQSHLVPKSPAEAVHDDTVKRLMDEVATLKTDISLLRMQNDELLRKQNDSLRNQIEELNQKLVDPAKLDVVKGKADGD